MKIMNADGTYSYHRTNFTDCVNHVSRELGYLSAFPINNVFRIKAKHDCIMNIRYAYGIKSTDKQSLLKLIKNAEYIQAQFEILKIISNE